KREENPKSQTSNPREIPRKKIPKLETSGTRGTDNGFRLMGISIRNRQRARGINLAYLRKVTRALLDVLLPNGEYDLAIHFVAKDEIIGLNETFVHHKGPTDVITFDYGQKGYLEVGGPDRKSVV